MKKLLLSAFALLMTLAAGAQTVTSPNGNVSVKFWLQDGRPTYEMSYKKKAVVKPSHLGLELAKDKHASNGQDEQNLMDGFTVKDQQTSTFDVTSLSASAFITRAWACVMSSRSSRSSIISL